MATDWKRLKEFLERGFRHVRILVVGDLMLDTYIRGRVQRISPEAPVPVVLVSSTKHAGGGAANVALNLANLGCAVSLAGFIGDDDWGRKLLELLSGHSIDVSGIDTLKEGKTTHKTRILGGHQHLVRIDEENTTLLSHDESMHVRQGVVSQLDESVSAIILSDYGKGVLDRDTCRALIDRCRQLNIPVLVDPKGREYDKYAGATALSPNRDELALATGCDNRDLDRLLNAGEKLRAQLRLEFMAVTLGELGIALLEPISVPNRRFGTVARDVFDVSGAGDTVIAIITAGLAAGMNRREAIEFANVAAGIVVGKVGTYPVSYHDLVARISLDAGRQADGKVFSKDELLPHISQWRSEGQRIVFTNGCYDLLHVGHICLLENAKRCGDRLVVGLNSDSSIRALKGEGRPIVGQLERRRVLAALSCVDAVVIFDEDNPLELIKLVHPDVLVKGSDYCEESVIGAKDVTAWGGRVVLVPLIQGFSTTSLLRKAAPIVH